MDIILNFAALRPVKPADAPVLTLASDSDFQRRLADAAAGASPQADAAALAQTFADTRFLRRPQDVAHGARLLSLFAQVRDRPLPHVDEAPAAVRQELQQASPDAFAADLERARDSVVAAYLLERGPDAGVARDLVRAYSIARALLAGTPARDDVEAMLRGPMALPDFIEKLRVGRPPAPAPAPAESAREMVDRINGLAEKRRLLFAALDDIALHAEDELVLSELGETQPLSALFRTPATRAGLAPPIVRDAQADARPPVPASDAPDSKSPLLRASARRNVLLSSKAVSLLPERTIGTLRGLDLDPVATPVAEMRAMVLRTQEQTGQQLLTLAGQFANTSKFIDTDVVHVDPSWFFDPVDAPDPPAPVTVAPPTTHVALKPLGVADLLLVRAHISRYERSEVASIENVLAHEKLTHTVRRLDSSETTTTAEQESTDLRTQTQTTAEEDKGHTTVQAVGPGVGPLAAEGASSFAQSVTDQVSSSSTKRVRRLATQRVLRESEETFEHLLDNSTGNAATYGVYQFLDKVYQAQIFTYGSRLLYDFIVPEPAAMFREALARPRSGLALPVKPAKFTLAPTKLTIDNWAYYAAGHRASGVDAPPPLEIVLTEPFAARAKDPFSGESATCSVIMSEARTTRIPKGYRAKRYRVAVRASGYPSGLVQVLVGTKSFRIEGPNGGYFRADALDHETETLPVGVTVDSDGVNWGVLTVAVGVEIICEATEELITAWQVKAHGLILAANQRRFDEYEEAVANRDASARIFLQSLSAPRKVSIVRTEMKRAALEVLTAQSFSGFNATTTDAMGFPYPHTAATIGLSAYIRFFEQAVEWEHLAYAFYPYFWGAQTSWISKLLAAESDAQFAGFLTSGAARAVLPIRRGYEGAFERFLNTGITPTTDELLDVGSALWVSLVDELRHQSADDWQEQAVGEPWEFRVASDLVRARADGSMPKWTLTQGRWTDAPDPAF